MVYEASDCDLFNIIRVSGGVANKNFMPNQVNGVRGRYDAIFSKKTSFQSAMALEVQHPM